MPPMTEQEALAMLSPEMRDKAVAMNRRKAQPRADAALDAAEKRKGAHTRQGPVAAIDKRWTIPHRAASVKRGTRISQGDPVFIQWIKDAQLPLPVCEYRFHPSRRWRFDYSWPAFKVALEVDGGAWTQGRHTRGKGFIKDQEKRNAATAMGWKVFNVTPDTLATNHTIAMLAAVFIQATIRPAAGGGQE